MKDRDIHAVIRILRRVTSDMKRPYVGRLADSTHDPFLILIATILSLRTRDAPTELASESLFKRARTPEQVARLSPPEIAELVQPTMYPLAKAENIHKIAKILVDKYHSQVPSDLDELDALPGVGRKTANLVITLGFHKPGICVDTHVHRITNRWGYVHTKTPDETELALREKLPRQYWMEINNELVMFGQNVCLPIGPKCTACPLFKYCERIGVKTLR